MHDDILAIQIFLSFFSIAAIFSAIYALGTRRKVIFTVKEKGTLTHGYTRDGHGTTYTNFMIYSKDNQCFKNTNTIWYWKWRSTELQAKIRVNKRYVATIYGWRIGAFNIYPNIVSVKPLRYPSHVKKKNAKRNVKKTLKKRR